MTGINKNVLLEGLKFIPKDAPKAKVIAEDVSTMISPLDGTLAKLRAIGEKVELEGPAKDTFQPVVQDMSAMLLPSKERQFMDNVSKENERIHNK